MAELDPVLGTWFDEFKDKYAEYRKTTLPAQRSMLAYQRSVVIAMLPNDESLRSSVAVDWGYTRFVFSHPDSDVVYKFEYCSEENQTKAEIEAATEWPDLVCFPKMYSWSAAKDCFAAEKVVSVQVCGISMYSRFPGLHELDKILLKGSKDKNTPKLRRLLDMQKPGQRRVVEDLVELQRRFTQKNGKPMHDLVYENNWGVAERFGEKVFLPLDVGI